MNVNWGQDISSWAVQANIYKMCWFILALIFFLSYICLQNQRRYLKKTKTVVQENFFRFRRSFSIWQKQTFWTRDEDQDKAENDYLLAIKKTHAWPFKLNIRRDILCIFSTCQAMLNILNKPSPPAQKCMKFPFLG